MAVKKTRHHYTLEEDESIFNYVAKHGKKYGQFGSVKGNHIWKEMESKEITSHPWQSMKDRYLKHIQHKEENIVINDRKPVSYLNESSNVTIGEDKDDCYKNDKPRKLSDLEISEKKSRRYYTLEEDRSIITY